MLQLSEVNNMQKDYMGMAQQSQAQAAPQGAPMAAGQQGAAMSFEQAKQTITNILNQFGSQIPQDSALPGQIDELARLLASGDEAAAEKHPLMQLILKVLEGSAKMAQEKGLASEGSPMMQQGMAAPPIKFAAMVKPPGGGMSGR